MSFNVQRRKRNQRGGETRPGPAFLVTVTSDGYSQIQQGLPSTVGWDSKHLSLVSVSTVFLYKANLSHYCSRPEMTLNKNRINREMQ